MQSSKRSLSTKYRATSVGALALISSVLMLYATPLRAGSISFAWSAVSDPDTAGYVLYYGTSSRSYSSNVDVGNVTSYTLNGLGDCTRYFVALKAYDGSGNFSGYSNEVSGLSTPSIASVAPASSEPGQSLTITLTGANFDTGAAVRFSGPGITVTTTSVQSCTQAQASVSIATSAAAGSFDIDLVNADGSYGRRLSAFQVLASTLPGINAATPVDGATNVAVAVRPTVSFSEPMNAASINAASVRILGPGGSPVAQAAGSPSLDGPGTTATITPASNLAASTTYQIQVIGGPSGVKDLTGNPLAATYLQSTGFRTVPPPDTAAPMVTSTVPIDGATNVAVSARPTVTFSEAMLSSTITAASVRLLGPGGALVAQTSASPSVDASGTVVTITPASALAADTIYIIQVVGGPSGVTDSAGNALGATYQQGTGFRTAAPPDTTGPSVNSTNPVDGATNVAATVRPTITFSEALRTSTVTTSSIRLLGPGGARINQGSGSPIVDGSGTVVTIVPAANLAASTTYQIQVIGGSSGVKDPAGNALASTYQQGTGFRTAAPPDTTAPTVASTAPVSGATNVAVSVRPTATFSEAMNATTLTASSVRLLGPGGSPVAQGAGSPSLDASGTVVTITPAASLATNTTYQIQVIGGSGGVKDAAGNALAATYLQGTGFRTVLPPDTTAPTVTSTTPVDGATNVAVAVSPTVTFSERVDFGTVDSSTIRLLGPGGTPVAQTPTSPIVDASGTVATITPAANLAADTVYVIQVVGGPAGVTDSVGNPLASTYQQGTGFRTAAPADTTPPTVTSATPVDGATSVDVSVRPTITFSEALRASTVTTSSIRLLGPGGARINQASSSPSLDASGTIVTVIPASSLAASTTYQIQVMGGQIRDVAGNIMAAAYLQGAGFRTAAPPDTTAPTVTSTAPVDGATNVAVSVRPTVTFSEPMNASTITAATVRLLGPGATPVAQAAGSPSLDASGTVATIVPAASLAAGVTYQVQALGFAGGVTDLAGNPMAATYQQSVGLRTSGGPDTTPPAVASTNPVDGATNVPMLVHPEVVFTEPMGASSISPSTVRLIGPGAAPVAQAVGSPSLDASGTVVTIVPASALGANVTYQIQVIGSVGGVKDVAGNPMSDTYQHNVGIRTALSLDSTPPTVSAVNPADAVTGVLVTVRPTVTFSEPINGSTVGVSSVRLLGPGGTPVPQAGGSPSLDGSGTVVTITPAAALAPNTLYQVQVVGGSGGVSDTAGNPIAGTYLQGSGFRTVATQDLTPPTVITTNPSDGARDIALASRPAVVFSEAMLPSSITPATVRLLAPGASLVAQAPGSPSLDPTGRIVTIIPASMLVPGITYQIQVLGFSDGVKDVAGNAMSDTYQHNNGIRTTVEPDTIPPVVSSSFPAGGATDVPTVRPSVTFSEIMGTSTITAATVRLLGAGGAPVQQAAGSPALSASGTVATIIPAASLTPGTTYQIQVLGAASGVKDASGNALASTWTLTPGFTVQATSALGVISVTPPGGVNGVDPGSAVQIRFSGLVDPDSVSSAGFRIQRSGSTGAISLSGAPVVSGDGTLVTLSVRGVLESGQSYTVAVKGGSKGVRDRNGRFLDRDFSSSPFTTVRLYDGALFGSAAALMAENWQTLTNGAEVPASAILAVRFREPIDAASVNVKVFKLLLSKKKIPLADGQPRLSEDGLTVLIESASTLPTGSTFQLTIKGGPKGIRTARGGVMSERVITLSFQTSLDAVESLGVAE